MVSPNKMVSMPAKNIWVQNKEKISFSYHDVDLGHTIFYLEIVLLGVEGRHKKDQQRAVYF